MVAAALAGDADAIQAVYAKTPVERISESDLLTRQMFIESRWEWPIAAHVQQLILFGLLPPMTWVLAAVVENLLY